MEEAPGPTPKIYNKEENVIKGEDNRKKVKKVLKEKEFSFIKNKITYILTCSRTDYDTIILKFRKKEKIIYFYYEKEYEYKKLSNFSKVFDCSENASESYEVLIDNIAKNNKDLIFDFSEQKVILTINFLFPSGKIRAGKTILDKKDIDIKIILNEMNINFNKIENQIEEKINTIMSEQRNIKEKLDKNINNIEIIKQSNSKLEELINQNKEEINKIRVEQNKYTKKFAKYEEEMEDNKARQANNEIEIKELNNFVIKNMNILEKKTNLVKEEQDKLENTLNNNNKNITNIDKQISTWKNSLSETNKVINLIKEKQKEMENKTDDFEDKFEKINLLELNIVKKIEYEKKEKIMNESLQKALKEIESLKNKINANEKNVNELTEKIKILEIDKNKNSKKIIEIKPLNDDKFNTINNVEDFRTRNMKFDSPIKINDIEEEKAKKYKINPIENKIKISKHSRMSSEPNNNGRLEQKKEDNIKFIEYNSCSTSPNKQPIQKGLSRHFSNKNFFKKSDNFKFVKNISTQLFNKNCYNNRACIFSRKDKIFIVYGIQKKANYFNKENMLFNLECYDYSKDFQYTLFKSFHKKPFDSCRYFYDSITKKDLIISTSLDRHVKVVEFKEIYSEIIKDFDFESIEGVIINTAIFVDNEVIFPFSFHKPNRGRLLFYDLEGNETNKIPQNEEEENEFEEYEYVEEREENPGFVLCLNSYYHKDAKIYYIIVSNTEGIFVYNLNDYSLYHKFIPDNNLKDIENLCFAEGCIIEKERKIILLGPIFSEGLLYLWDLINKDLIKVIKLSYGISDLCIWNNNYIFATLLYKKYENWRVSYFVWEFCCI